MLTVALSSLLALVPSPRSHASPPAVSQAEAGAWAVVHAGQLWVCWSPAPNCWSRVTLESDEDGPADVLEDSDAGAADFVEAASSSTSAVQGWRLGFWGPRTLWIERDGRRWRVERGQRLARATTTPAPLPLVRPRVHTCGPRGSTPAWRGGRLDWQPAPRCETRPASQTAPRACVASGPGFGAGRSPTPVRVRAGLQLAAKQQWTSAGDDARALEVARVRARAAVEVLFVVELGLDLAAARRDERARAALRRDRRRELPPVPPGPLAAAERRALTTVVCKESDQ